MRGLSVRDKRAEQNIQVERDPECPQREAAHDYSPAGLLGMNFLMMPQIVTIPLTAESIATVVSATESRRFVS
jgi:hypothetical protein